MADYGQVLKHPLMELYVMVVETRGKNFTGIFLADNSGFATSQALHVAKDFSGERRTVDEDDPSHGKWIIIDD